MFRPPGALLGTGCGRAQIRGGPTLANTASTLRPTSRRTRLSRAAAATADAGADANGGGNAAPSSSSPSALPQQQQQQQQQQQPKPKLFYATYNAAQSGKLTTFGFRRNLERDFELGATLGTGGFGTVRVAVEKSTGRRYAAKLLPKRFVGGRALEPLYAARVLHEVDALAAVGNSLNASHLVAAYEDERSVALVMELCSGGPLLSRVQPGKWGEREAARVMRDVVRALAHCHSVGVVVRDVKPDNFLFRDASPRSPLKMIDFGLAATLPPAAATVAAPTTTTTAAAGADAGAPDAAAPPPPPPPPAPKLTDRAGTPHFCAPEVLRMSYSFPADVWSAGVIAYLLLAGRFPWARDAQAEQDGREAAEAAAEAGGRARGGGGIPQSAFGAQGPMAAGGMLANKDLFRAILRGELDFDEAPFNTPAVSEEARDCVRSMLRRDPDARPTAAELLRHPWLARAGEDEGLEEEGGEEGGARGGERGGRPPPLEASLVQRLQRYGAYGRLRQLALRRVAHLALLEHEEEEEDGGGGGRQGGGVLGRVIRAFASLPRGADGRVPYDAVADALAQYDLSDTERRMLVLQLDADRDGRVDLDEFAAATADWGALRSEGGSGSSGSDGGSDSGDSDGGGGGGGGRRGGGPEAWGRWLRAVFDTLDQDHSGRISAEELEDALCRVDFSDDEEEGGEEGGDGKKRAAAGAGAGVGAAGGDVAETGVEAARLCDPGAVAAALREADADGDGALSLREFEALLQGGGGGGAALGGGDDELLDLFPARLRRRDNASDTDSDGASSPARTGEE